MTPESIAITPAASLAQLAALQPVAEAIFGPGDRRRDWLARKLRRECVEPRLCRIAVASGDGTDRVRGYVLVGRPPSLPGLARTAGTGVLPTAQGHGVGTALLQAAAAAAADDGCSALELWGTPAREPYYRARGFEVVARVVTLRADGCGDAQHWRDGLDEPDDAEGMSSLPHGYLDEAWRRTEDEHRGVLWVDRPRAWIRITREGVAFVLHRIVVQRSADAAAVLQRVRQRLPAGAPILALALREPGRPGDADAALGSDEPTTREAVSSVTASLRRRGWRDAQRATILRRPLVADAGQRAPPLR
ncbi:MAG: GNAT family N-acetyltransferase [Nannocystaceae bacterium]|nr:GNAT family N-acetyltransferase [Nannocystaceae bacterium]